MRDEEKLIEEWSEGWKKGSPLRFFPWTLSFYLNHILFIFLNIFRVLIYTIKHHPSPQKEKKNTINTIHFYTYKLKQ